MDLPRAPRRPTKADMQAALTTLASDAGLDRFRAPPPPAPHVTYLTWLLTVHRTRREWRRRTTASA